MSNKVISLTERLARKNRPTCKKCRGRDVSVKSYDDGYDLHICNTCHFPRRVKR